MIACGSSIPTLKSPKFKTISYFVGYKFKDLFKASK